MAKPLRLAYPGVVTITASHEAITARLYFPLLMTTLPALKTLTKRDGTSLIALNAYTSVSNGSGQFDTPEDHEHSRCGIAMEGHLCPCCAGRLNQRTGRTQGDIGRRGDRSGHVKTVPHSSCASGVWTKRPSHGTRDGIDESRETVFGEQYSMWHEKR